MALTSPAHAAHTKARLVLAADAERPGEPLMAGVLLEMEPNWHTYWKNAGDSGLATTIDWELPEGITAGEIQWPVPEKLTEGGLTTYIYKDQVLLLVPLKLAPTLKPGTVELKAKVTWLECEVKCIREEADVRASLVIAKERKVSQHAELFETWKSRLPKSGAGLAARAWWEKEPAGDTRPVILEWPSAQGAGQADFYPYLGEQFEVQANTEKITSEPGKIALRAQVKKLAGDWPKELAGVLVESSGGERTAYDVKLPMAAAAATTTAGLAAPQLWKMLLYALLGGLILNVMPCVLPVIALKILGFVGQAADAPGQVRKLGLIYTLGVLVSFLVLAGLVIGLKAAGHRAGWGMQFANPQFLVAITALVTLVALNLFGLFEINLSGRVMGAAGTLASKHGAAGAFFNGVLATVLATPCTAPFLGLALGFAFSQPTSIILLIFLMAGFGLALPYLLLSWHPAWLKFLPKPGPWMEKFKIAMGFPMLATAFWLLSLTPIHYGERSWWLGIFLVLLALAAWIYGEFVQRGTRRRGVAIAVALVLLTVGSAGILEAKLQWRSKEKANPADKKLAYAPKGIAWQPWSSAAVAEARAQGRPVVVDFTAQWCATCNIYVKPALENAAVQKKLKEINAAPLLADYTLTPGEITDELKRFSRAGVPMVLVYPKNSSLPPMVYDVVTSRILLEALEKAAL